MRRFRDLIFVVVAFAASFPVAAAKPVGVKPAGSPGNWISPDDYPPEALRQSQVGTTAFRLAVDKDGHVTDCTVTASSGTASLDAATCRALVARASFVPARDHRGQTIAATYSSSVHWQIPHDSGSPRFSMFSCAVGLPTDIRIVTLNGCVR